MKNMNIAMADGVFLNNHIYFSNVPSNGLFRINVNTKKMEIIGFFQDERIEAGFLHKRCFAYGDKIFFLPAYSRSIDIYDASTGEFLKITFENEVEGEAVLDAVKVESDIYIFPRNARCVPIKLNMETMDFSEVPGFDTWIDDYVPHDDPEKFYRVTYNDGRIYFAIRGTDLVAEWNLITNDFNTYKTALNNIINVYVSGNTLYFSLREKYGLGKLDLKNGNVKYMECADKNIYNANMYGCVFKLNDGVGLAPAYGKYIHCFDENGCIWEYKTDDEIEGDYKFYRYAQVGDDIWLLPLVINEIYILRKDYKIHKMTLSMSDEIMSVYKKALLKERMMDKPLISEDADCKLEDFVGYISGK